MESKLGAATPVTSIALGVGNNDAKSGSTLSFGPGGTALPKIIDPVQAFNLLFANFVVPATPRAGGADPCPHPRTEHHRFRTGRHHA